MYGLITVILNAFKFPIHFVRIFVCCGLGLYGDNGILPAKLVLEEG